MDGRMARKIAVAAAMVLLVIAFLALGLGRYFSLDYLKVSQAGFNELYAGHRIAVIAAYMAIYIVMAALSLPGAAIMTIAGGAMFGLTIGTIAVSFASSLGATLACAASRFVLRDWVQRRFGARLAEVNAGIAKEGNFYLFSLRLIPVFPFWLINLVMGLTPMPLRSFYWVSQAGMLAGTIVYVNAGRQLASLNSLSGVLSPGLIASLVLLGVFPIAAKRLLSWYRSQRRTGG